LGRPSSGGDRPIIAQTFFIRISVLRDDGGYALGMRDCEAEADGRSVVEDVDGVFRQAECGYEGIDGFGH